MGAQGTATLDFGVFPGKSDASVAVTGQTAILSGSLVEAWIFPATTTEHSIDEHYMASEFLMIVAGEVVAGTGFTIRGIARGDDYSPTEIGGSGYSVNRSESPRTYGQYNIAWAWN